MQRLWDLSPLCFFHLYFSIPFCLFMVCTLYFLFQLFVHRLMLVRSEKHWSSYKLYSRAVVKDYEAFTVTTDACASRMDLRMSTNYVQEVQSEATKLSGYLQIVTMWASWRVRCTQRIYKLWSEHVVGCYDTVTISTNYGQVRWLEARLHSQNL